MKLLEKIRKNSKTKFDEIKKKINIKKNYTIIFDNINKEPKEKNTHHRQKNEHRGKDDSTSSDD